MGKGVGDKIVRFMKMLYINLSNAPKSDCACTTKTHASTWSGHSKYSKCTLGAQKKHCEVKSRAVFFHHSFAPSASNQEPAALHKSMLLIIPRERRNPQLWPNPCNVFSFPILPPGRTRPRCQGTVAPGDSGVVVPVTGDLFQGLQLPPLMSCPQLTATLGDRTKERSHECQYGFIN